MLYSVAPHLLGFYVHETNIFLFITITSIWNVLCITWIIMGTSR